MFRWAIIFAVIALIASLLGFGGVAGLSKDFAVILLVVAVILVLLALFHEVGLNYKLTNHLVLSSILRRIRDSSEINNEPH